MSHTASAAPTSLSQGDTVAIPFLTCSACHAAIQANAAKTSGSAADTQAASIDATAAPHDAAGADLAAAAAALIECELWPADSELVASIRAMFLSDWGLNGGQADARMSRLNYQSAAALIPATPPGAIGSAWAGGIYAGVSRGIDGAPDQHLVLITGEAVDVDWEAAGTWAASVGGSLPTRREQRLLHTNIPEQFQHAWYWSCEQAGPSNAWSQHFYDGSQDYYNRSYEGRARAVRRLPI